MGAKIKRRKGKDKGEGREEGLGTFSKGFLGEGEGGKEKNEPKIQGEGIQDEEKEGEGDYEVDRPGYIQ